MRGSQGRTAHGLPALPVCVRLGASQSGFGCRCSPEAFAGLKRPPVQALKQSHGEADMSTMSISTMTPERDPGLCTAHKGSTGEPCKVHAIAGATVCIYHGGRAPQVREAAQKRLLAATNPALSTLERLVSDPSVAEAIALGAAKDILDRVGLAPVKQIEVDAHDSTEARQLAALTALRELEPAEEDA